MMATNHNQGRWGPTFLRSAGILAIVFLCLMPAIQAGSGVGEDGVVVIPTEVPTDAPTATNSPTESPTDTPTSAPTRDPFCAEDEVTQWGAFTSCPEGGTCSGEGIQAQRKRERAVGITKETCIATLVEEKYVQCEKKDCAAFVPFVGEMSISGISCPLSAAVEGAIIATLASVTDADPSDVELTLPCAARRSGDADEQYAPTGGSRRGLSIAIVFKISLPSAALASSAVTALDSSVSDGSLGSTLVAEADARGATVPVPEFTVTTTCATCGSAVASIFADGGATDGVYYTMLLINFALLLAIVVHWVFVGKDIKQKKGLSDVHQPYQCSKKLSMFKTQAPTTKEDSVFGVSELESREIVKTAALNSGPALELLASTAAQISVSTEKIDAPEEEAVEPPTVKCEPDRSLITPVNLRFDIIDKALPVVGLVLTLCFLIASCVTLPLASYDVISNATVPSQCAAQNFAQLVTTRCVSDLQTSVERNALMLKNGVVSWKGVEAYTNNSDTTVYTASLPAVMLGVLSSTTDLVSLWAVLNDGSVFSTEWVPTSAEPVGRMYSHTTKQCWQASYKAKTGYGTWNNQTTGPLGVACENVTAAAWYTRANVLSGAETTSGPISSGYSGISHMLREASTSATFGGELDGRTLSAKLAKGKPIQGEIYVVAADASGVDALVAASEDEVKLQLKSTVTVDPSAVGGLTGQSALNLESKFSSFYNMWSNSLTSSSADAAGMVDVHCPSTTTPAYVAIHAGSDFFSTMPPTSVMRFQTTSTLQLVMVNAIKENAYTNHMVKSFIVTLCFAMATGYFLVMLFLRPFQSAPRFSRMVLSAGALLFVTLIVLLWTIRTTTHHRDAINDLFLQLTNSMDTFLPGALADSLKMLKQAHQTWQLTGAATTTLAPLSVWSADIMQDFYSSTRLSSLRFATTGGLERSSNGTGTGVRVLSREFTGTGASQTSCLRTYNTSGSLDSSQYPDNCHYDPRYTPWYGAARVNFASGAANPAVVDSLYSIGATGKLGMGVVTKGDLGAGFIAAWAAEFTLDSVGDYFGQLADGLHGTLYIGSNDEKGKQDGYLITASSQSVTNIGLCTTNKDKFIANSATYLINSYGAFYKAKDAAVIRDHSIVRTKVASLTSGLLDIVSLARGQFYTMVDQMLDTVFLIACLGSTVLLTLAYVQSERRDARLNDARLRNNECDEDDEDDPEDKISFPGITEFVRPRILELEDVIYNSIKAEHPDATNSEIDELTSQRCRELAITFMRQGLQGKDATEEVALLLRTSGHPWLRSILSMFGMLGNPCALAAIAMEVICETHEWDENLVFVLQGIFVVLIGLDVLSWALRSVSTRQVRRLWVLPAVWVLLFISCFLSQSYYSQYWVHQAKHYAYPLFLVMRNHSFWKTVWAFSRSVLAAATVILLFFCFLIASSVVAMVMLQGVYTTGDYHVDNQYYDFSTTFTTMFVLLQNADNYVDAAMYGMVRSLWYAIFFIFTTTFGAFVVQALLIEAFCGSYEGTAAQVALHALRKKRRSLVATIELWTRHSHCRKQSSGPVFTQLTTVDFQDQSLTFDTFVDMLVTTEGMGWTRRVKDLTTHLVTHIESIDRSSLSQPVYEFLLDLCAELAMEDAYQRVVNRTDDPAACESIAERRKKTQTRVPKGCTYDEAGWVRGRAPPNTHLAEAIAALPRLTGLPSGRNKVENSVCKAMCQILEILSMEKWSLHRIYCHIEKKDEMHAMDRVEELLRMCHTMDPLATSKMLRFESARLAVGARLEQLREQGANVVLRTDGGGVRGMVKLVGCEILMARERCESFELHDAGVKRCQQAHSHLPIHQDGAPSLCSQCLSEALVDELYNWGDGVDVQQALDQTLADYDSHAVRLEEFHELRQDLEQLLVDEKMKEFEKHDQAIFQLVREETRLEEVSKRAEPDSSIIGVGDLRFFFNMISWVNLLVLSFYYCNGTEEQLDKILVVLSLAPWIEVFYMAARTGLWKYLDCKDLPAERITILASLAALCVSAVGCALLISDSGVVALGTARFITGFATLLVLTKSETFSEMFIALTDSVNVAWPTLGVMLVIVCLYSLAARDLFGKQATTDTGGDTYYSTYGRSLSTMFQFFIGEGWTAAMYSTTDDTTEAARLFIMSYIGIVSLLMTELIVGVVVQVFSDICGVQSKHVYSLFSSTCGEEGGDSRDNTKEEMLGLTIGMVPLYEALGIMYDTSKEDRCNVHDLDMRNSQLNLFFDEVADSLKLKERAPEEKELLDSHLDTLLCTVNCTELLEQNTWLNQVSPQSDMASPLSREMASPFLRAHSNGSDTDSSSGVLEIEMSDMSEGVSPEVERNEKERAKHLKQLRHLPTYRLVLGSFILLFVIVLVLGLILILFDNAFTVVNNDKRLIQCQSQSHSKLTVDWLVRDLIDTVTRSEELVKSADVTAAFSGSTITGSFPSTIMGLVAAGIPYLCSPNQPDKCSPSGSLFGILEGPGAGHVMSAEISAGQASPTAHLFRHDTELCYEATYDSTTGLGAWTSTTMGPLNTACSAVTASSWYTTALTLTNSENRTLSGQISTGTGVMHMRHEPTNNAVFGGEMDSRTLSAHLKSGKPVAGEIYVVQAGTTDVLIATTETGVSTGGDPSTAGGLTGQSSKNLEETHGTFEYIWSQSSTVDTADAAELVSQRCPSTTTAAYVSVYAGEHIFSSKPATSLQRYQTTSDLKLVILNSLKDQAYRTNLSTVFVMYVVCALLLLLVAIPLAFVDLPAVTKPIEKYLKIRTGPQHKDEMYFAIAFLILIPSLAWLITVSKEHTSATQDLATQVTTSIAMALGTKLESSTSLVKQAAATWYFTGAATTGLSALDSWTTTLLEDYYTSSNMSSLRFGTHQGLEESVNSTSNGVRVLSRANYTDSCLKTYLADGTTSDSAVYGDNCNHDPRYTSWYEAGRALKNDTGFSNTYNNTYLAALAKACTSNNCTASDSLLGVFAGEWTITSVGAMLDELKDGFLGSLGVVEVTGIILASSSGVTLEPVAATTDKFLKQTAEVNWPKVKPTPQSEAGHSLIGYSMMRWSAYSDADDKFVAVMSLDRFQFFKTYDETRCKAVAMVTIGLILLSLVVELGTRKSYLRLLSTANFDKRVYKRFQEFYSGPDEHSVRLKMYIQALEWHFIQNPVSYFHLETLWTVPGETDSLGDAIAPANSADRTDALSEEVPTREALQLVAAMFLQDLTRKIDVELHCILLMCNPTIQKYLLPIFRLTQTSWYMLLVNLTLVVLMFMGWVEEFIAPIHVMGLIFLSFDAVIISLMALQFLRKFEYIPDDSDVPKSIPRKYEMRTTAYVGYSLFQVVVLIGFMSLQEKGSDVANYCFPMMVLLRNPRIWPEILVFVSAIMAAGSVAYLWLCVLVVLSALTTVLLHGQHKTGDFYNDFQFYDFYHSISTMSIYMISLANYEQVVEPSLQVDGLYVLLWIFASMFGVFFITAILLQIFAHNYSTKAEKPPSEGARRSDWATLSSMFMLLAPDSQVGQQHKGMRPVVFEELILQCEASIDWTGNICELLVQKTLALLVEHECDINNYRREVAALATICCELDYESAYQAMIDRGWLADLPYTSNDARDEMKLPQALVRLGLATEAEDSQLKYVQSILGAVTPRTVRSVLYNTSVPLVVMKPQEAIPAAIMCSYHLFRFSDKESEVDPDNIANWAHSVATEVYMLGSSGSDKTGLECPVCLEPFTVDGSHAPMVLNCGHSVCETCGPTLAHGSHYRCFNRCQQTTSELRPNYALREQLEQSHSEQAPLTPRTASRHKNQNPRLADQVMQLVKLVQVQKCRVRELFNSIKKDQSPNIVMPEFDRMWCMARFNSAVAASPLLQNEAEVMLLKQEIQMLDEEIADANQDEASRAALEVDKTELCATLTHFEAEINVELGGTFNRSDDRLATLQFIALLNLTLVAYFGNPAESTVTLDVILTLFSAGFALEFGWNIYSKGWKATMYDPKNLDVQIASWMSLSVTVTSVFGTCFVVFDQAEAGMGRQSARTLASFSVLLLLTWNKQFGRIFLAFSRAAGTCIPIILAILMFVIVYSVASKDMFKDKVINPDTGLPYFDTTGRALATAFRMFNGDWHEIMAEATIETTEAAQLWFTGYLFLVTVFAGNLFVGIIMAQYIEVESVESPRLYAVLDQIFAFGSEDRAQIIVQLLRLNRRLRMYNMVYTNYVLDLASHPALADEVQGWQPISPRSPKSPSLEPLTSEDATRPRRSSLQPLMLNGNDSDNSDESPLGNTVTNPIAVFDVVSVESFQKTDEQL